MKTQFNAILQYCQNHQVDIVANQKVFEEDLQIKNFQAEIILLIKHQLSGIQRAQQKCCQQSSISTKVLPVLLQIYKRLCEQCLIQVKNL